MAMPREAFKKFAVLMLMGMRRCDRKQRKHLKQFVRQYGRKLDFLYPNGMTEEEANEAIRKDNPEAAQQVQEVAKVAPRLIIPTGINPETLK